MSSSLSSSSSELDGKSPGCAVVFFLRAMAASFLALAAARRSSRDRTGFSFTSSSEDSSSSLSSSSPDSSDPFPPISLPSASSGLRFREKCLPPESTGISWTAR
jgi:hypothetical protein